MPGALMTCPPCGGFPGVTVNQLMYHTPEIAGGELGDAVGEALGDALGEPDGEGEGDGDGDGVGDALGDGVAMPLKRFRLIVMHSCVPAPLQLEFKFSKALLTALI